jgi:hypothetical protein
VKPIWGDGAITIKPQPLMHELIIYQGSYRP